MKRSSLGFTIFLCCVIGGVLATAVTGLWLSGSPTQERARKIDQRRVSDLQNISNVIDQYYNTNSALPSDLDTLTKSRETYWVGSISDPETSVPYDYRKTAENTYDLCATFATDSTEEKANRAEPYPMPENRFWEHGPTYTCFTITARTYPAPTPK